MNTINGKIIGDKCIDSDADLPLHIQMNPEMYQDILNYGNSNDDCMHFSDADIKVTKVLPNHLEPPPRLKWINGTWTPWSECPNDIGIDLDEDPDEERRFSLSRIKMQYICTSEGGGPCNSAFLTQMASFTLLLLLIDSFY